MKQLLAYTSVACFAGTFWQKAFFENAMDMSWTFLLTFSISLARTKNIFFFDTEQDHYIIGSPERNAWNLLLYSILNHTSRLACRSAKHSFAKFLAYLHKVLVFLHLKELHKWIIHISFAQSRLLHIFVKKYSLITFQICLHKVPKPQWIVHIHFYIDRLPLEFNEALLRIFLVLFT